MAKKRRIVLRVAVGFAVVVLVAALAAYGWLQLAPRRVPSGQPALETLRSGSLAAVRQVFNAGVGEIRVLAMLSPT